MSSNPKPAWLSQLEASSLPLTLIDLSHVKSSSSASNSTPVPILPWDHMQSLCSVLESQFLQNLTEINFHSLRIGDVGLSLLVDRVLIKESTQIAKVDLRNNSITASGLRQALVKLFAFNFTITTLLFDENSSSSSSSHSSSGSSNDRPRGASKSTSPTSSPSTEPPNMNNMTLAEISERFIPEFVKMNQEITACTKGESTSLSLTYTMKHPRIAPARLAKILSLSSNTLSSLTLEGWRPPPPLTLRSQEKKLSKLSPEQLAIKEAKRHVPANLFSNLPKLNELKMVKCSRIDSESKKGTLRVFKTGTSFVKSSYIDGIPSEVSTLPSLRRLIIQECGIEELNPSSLSHLHQLELFDFSSNEIPSIPPQISQLVNLTRLYLHSNSITEVPTALSSIGFLRELWLFDNLITKVPTGMAKWFPVMKDLRILSQRVEEGYSMEDPQLLELKNQESDLITSKSAIGYIGFLGYLKHASSTEIILYKSSKKKGK